MVRHLCRAVSSTIVPPLCQPCGNRTGIFHVFQEQGLEQGIGSGFHGDCVVAISPVALLLCCKNNSVLNPLGRDICPKSLLFYTVDTSCHGTMEPQDTEASLRATNQLGSKDNGKEKPQFSILISSNQVIPLKAGGLEERHLPSRPQIPSGLLLYVAIFLYKVSSFSFGLEVFFLSKGSRKHKYLLRFCSSSKIREGHDPSFTMLSLYGDTNFENYILKCQILKY